LDNSTILQKIQSQPKRTAGYKQLVRELGIRGNERRELAQRLRALVRKGELLELERPLHRARGGGQQEPGCRQADDAPRRLRLRRAGERSRAPQD